jgi:hypothetical protein
MKLNDKYDKFIDFIYDEFRKSEDLQRYGEDGPTLITRFQRATNIKFVDTGYEDERLKQAAIRYLYERGWIKPYSKDGHTPKTSFDYNDKFKPTNEGTLYVERRRISLFKKVYRDLYISILTTLTRMFTR